VTEDMKGIERQLDGADRDRVGFVLFSLDPGRDTPAALSRFAKEHDLEPSRWRLFAASEDGVRDLAAVLGVKYRRDEGGQIGHSAMIFVIDREGVVRHRQVGINQDPHDLITALRHPPANPKTP
jgi:protein SCO1/2